MTLRPERRGKLLSGLRLADPEQWRETVREALESHGEVPAAAAGLGIGRSTLYGWIAEDPSLTRGIELPPRGLRRSY